MPSSISVTRWSHLSEEVLAAIQSHAAMKSSETIDWNAWLQIDPGRGHRLDVPYDMSEILNIALEDLADLRRWSWPVFVPYRFDDTLCPDWPPPDAFWRDEVVPDGWTSEYLTIVDAGWVRINWRGTHDAAYRERAEHFWQEFLDHADGGGSDEQFAREYHYVEVGLMRCLEYAFEHHLSVMIYP